ncbi:tyrosinase-like isoform X2 [Hyperolius riggenbachi]
MLALCIFLSLCFNGIHGQFPRTCTTRQALDEKKCCPIWTDGSPCGEASGRGKCRDWVVPVSIKRKHFMAAQENDERLNWPKFFYDNTCECFGNYSGNNCGDCQYGHFGAKCERKSIVVRKEIHELSLAERKKFFSYLNLAKNTKSKDFVIVSTGDRYHLNTYQFVDASIYDVFAWIHYYSTKSLLINGEFDSSRNYAHQGPAFPGWHRLGLAFLERQIQLLTSDENFALPYYDWRGEKNCSICTNDLMGANNDQGALDSYSNFASWKIICGGENDREDAYCLAATDVHQRELLQRKPGTTRSVTLPSFKDVEDTLQWKQFDTPPYDRTAQRSFRNVLEGFLRPSDGVTQGASMHNLAHVYFGGTMGRVPISANDPMFVLHHCFVDKILEAWLEKYKATPAVYSENTQRGQGAEECATPYFPCYRNKDLINRSDKFGYTYSVFQNL